MQEAAYIIKQDGMPLRRTIRSMILSQGLPIVASKCLRLPMRAFETLYPRLDHLGVPLEVWSFNTVFNTTGHCEIGILRTHSARDRFLKLAGHDSDPASCEVGTIRREFGASRANVVSGYPIHLKVVHRSATVEEWEKDLKVIRSLLGA